MPYHSEDYYKSHVTNKGKNDQYSEGSVSDRAGNYDTTSKPGSVVKRSKKKKISGHGFGSANSY